MLYAFLAWIVLLFPGMLIVRCFSCRPYVLLPFAFVILSVFPLPIAVTLASTATILSPPYENVPFLYSIRIDIHILVLVILFVFIPDAQTRDGAHKSTYALWTHTSADITVAIALALPIIAYAAYLNPTRRWPTVLANYIATTVMFASARRLLSLSPPILSASRVQGLVLTIVALLVRKPVWAPAYSQQGQRKELIRDQGLIVIFATSMYIAVFNDKPQMQQHTWIAVVVAQFISLILATRHTNRFFRNYSPLPMPPRTYYRYLQQYTTVTHRFLA